MPRRSPVRPTDEPPTIADTVEELVAKLGIDEAQARFYLSDDKSCTFAVDDDGKKRRA